VKKTYTKKQIQEAIAYWKKQLAKGNYRKVNEAFEYSGENPYDIDNCKASGWVMYFRKNGEAYLPVDYTVSHRLHPEDDPSPHAADIRATDEQMNRVRLAQANASTVASRSCRFVLDGRRVSATFFATRDAAQRAADASEMDGGGAQSCAYIWDCVNLGYVSENDVGDLEKTDVEIIDTYICGNGAVIFGQDALEDNADEWERDTRRL